MQGVKKLLILAVTGACMAGCSESVNNSLTATHNVFVTVPESVGVGKELVFPAVVEEARTISVGFKTAGQIQRIFVHEGQRVSEGQILAMLDTADYSIGISTLREKYRQMVVENERRARLHSAGNMSDNDYENAISGMRQLALQLQLEENKLGYCTLKSPASGVITKVNFEQSEMVDAGTPVFELMDNSHLEVVVDLPVRHFADREKFNGFSGESSLINGAVELKMLSLTPRADNAQLYRLRLTPANAVDGITPGMNMTVKISCEGTIGQNVSIPLSSIFEREGREYVWVVNPVDSVISARQVEANGMPVDGCVEVTGITPHDLIVRAGVHHLTEAERVNILQ